MNPVDAAYQEKGKTFISEIFQNLAIDIDIKNFILFIFTIVSKIWTYF